jgi:glycosidase
MIYYGTEIGMFGADDPRNRMPMWWGDLAPFESEDYVLQPELHEMFRQHFKLRAEQEALRRGDFYTLLTDDAADVYAYLRATPEGKNGITVVLNNSDKEQTVHIPAPTAGVFTPKAESSRKLFGDGVLREDESGLSVTLKPLSGMVVLQERATK